MADPIVEKLQEDHMKVKATQRRRIRAVLIVVNALLLSYFTFLLVNTIVDYVKTNLNDGDDSIICINGKSQTASKNIYEKFIDPELNVNVCDYAIYGHYLYLSDAHITPTNTYYEDSIILVQMDSSINIPYETSLQRQLGNKLNNGIDLFSIDIGDYIVARNENVNVLTSRNYKYAAYHYTGKDLFTETIYSFPNEKGVRKQVTVSGKDSSPAVVISVKETTSFPSDYYDLVVVGNENSLTGLSSLKDTKMKVKYCDAGNPLIDAYIANSTYCINVTSNEDSSIVSSSFIDLTNTTNSETIENGVYATFDKDNYIRELGGYIFNAGYGVKNYEDNIVKASKDIMNNKKNSHTGKITLSVGNQTDFSAIKNIIGL